MEKPWCHGCGRNKKRQKKRSKEALRGEGGLYRPEKLSVAGAGHHHTCGSEGHWRAPQTIKSGASGTMRSSCSVACIIISKGVGVATLGDVPGQQRRKEC
eukprot:5001310-Amphidinium_carterae.1